MKIAINGAGIGGPTLAYWLRKYGYEPILFEKAPELRNGGYVIDFWGNGYDIAEKMGLFPDLLEDAYVMERLRTVTSKGLTTSSLNVATFKELTDGRYLSIARSDLSKRIFATCEGIETRFGTSIDELDDQPDKIVARLSNGSTEDFDLVIGADGLHSNIREQVFGPQSDFEHPVGFSVAAFMLDGYHPRDELTYLSHTVPNRQVTRLALREDKTLFLFIFANSLFAEQPKTEAQEKALLREIYADMGWETRAILSRLDEVEDIYFDRVSQIRMPNWHKGRVALLGDAAACASLLAGEGTGLAMTEAYVLAGELHRANGDHKVAFNAYQNRLQTDLLKKQDNALKFAGFFAPKSWTSLIMRDVLTNIASIPFMAKLMLKGSLGNKLDLPDYAADKTAQFKPD